MTATDTPTDRIPELLERVDLVDLVSRFAGPPAKVAGDVVTFTCPHRDHPDQTPSFTVTLADNRWHCWSRCARHGDAIELVEWLEGCTRADAIEQLAAAVGLARPARDHPPLELAWPIVHNFVEARQWNPSVIDELGIRPAIRSGGHPAVRFPIRRAGREVSHVDRQLGDRQPKWLNAPGPIPCPYEADRVATAHQVGELLVVEGIADTVAVISDFPNAAVIGCPGVGAFKKHWGRMLEGLRVLVIADNDDAGPKLRDRITSALDGKADVRQAHLPQPHHDLDDWRRHCLDNGGTERWEHEMRTLVNDPTLAGITT